MSLVPSASLTSPVKAEAAVSLEGMKGLPGQTQQPAKQNMCITITNKFNEAQLAKSCYSNTTCKLSTDIKLSRRKLRIAAASRGKTCESNNPCFRTLITTSKQKPLRYQTRTRSSSFKNELELPTSSKRKIFTVSYAS